MPLQQIVFKLSFKTSICIAVVITAFLYSFSAFGVMNKVSSSNLTVWTVPSLKRIQARETGGSNLNIELYAARGEYESYQIGIRAAQNSLKNVNVSVSDLYSSDNRVISKENITLYREHYVPVNNSSPKQEGSSNPPLEKGWFADGLIPFNQPGIQADLTEVKLKAVPFNIQPEFNQPVWVDIFVPRNTEPGQYQGNYRVTSDSGEIIGKVSLKIWNFELPLKPSLNSSFEYYEQESKDAMVELLKHRLMPVAKIDLSDERELIDVWGLNSLRLPFWSGANYKNCEMKPAPSVNVIKDAATRHQSDLFLYVRYADEIDLCSNLIEPVKEWARNIHEAGLSTAIAMTPRPELYDNGVSNRSAVDTWIISPANYANASDKVFDVIQKGDKVWFYNALALDDYSPKWLIDFDPINFRIPHGFISQSLGLTGVLYWRTDLWAGNPWEDEQTLFQDGNYYPGEGMLVYSGKEVGIEGVVPSIRLKWIRDGVEDYEYINILKDLKRGDWALEVSRSVGKDWKNWTKNSEVLESARLKLGEEIEKLVK